MRAPTKFTIEEKRQATAVAMVTAVMMTTAVALATIAVLMTPLVTGQAFADDTKSTLVSIEVADTN